MNTLYKCRLNFKRSTIVAFLGFLTPFQLSCVHYIPIPGTMSIKGLQFTGNLTPWLPRCMNNYTRLNKQKPPTIRGGCSVSIHQRMASIMAGGFLQTNCGTMFPYAYVNYYQVRRIKRDPLYYVCIVFRLGLGLEFKSPFVTSHHSTCLRG